LFFLPYEFQQQRELPQKHVVSCCLSSDATTAIALVATKHQHQRSNRILQVSVVSGQPTIRDITPALTPECLTFDPTSSRMFVGDLRGSIHEVQFDLGTVKSLFIGHVFRSYPFSLATTLDASKLMINDEFGLYAWKLDRQAEVIHSPIWNKLDRTITCFALAPDSKAGFCGRAQHNRSQILEFETDSGNLKPIFDNLTGTLQRIVISRDGLFLLAVSNSGAIILWRRETSQHPWEEHFIDGMDTGLSCVASFSPNSNVLITSDGTGHRLNAWNLTERKLLYEFAPIENNLHGCAFLDDEQVLSWGMDDKLLVWKLNIPAPTRVIRL
jgi:hypothetical protein